MKRWLRLLSGISFAGHSIEQQTIERVSGRQNIVARIKGKGMAPPLLLYGHVDVVSTEKQQWLHEPFSGDIVDGYLWGRGALDMKGGVAMLTDAFTRFSPHNRPPGDLILAIVADEEAGGRDGAGYLVDHHPSLFSQVKHAVGEFGGFTLDVLGQTFMPIQVTEKRTTTLRVTFAGDAGHSAIHSGDNVIAQACKFVSAVESTGQPIKIEQTVRDMITEMASGVGPKGMLLTFLLNPFTAPLALKLGGERFRAVFEPLIRTTLRVTGIETEKGTSNLVPSEAVVTLSGRLLPSEEGTRLLDFLQRLAGPNATVDGHIADVATSAADLSQISLIKSVVGKHFSDATVVPMMLPGSTDARHFARLGIQTYGFLPMRLPSELKFMSLIHSADERCPVDSLIEGADVLVEYIDGYRG